MDIINLEVIYEDKLYTWKSLYILEQAVIDNRGKKIFNYFEDFLYYSRSLAIAREWSEFNQIITDDNWKYIKWRCVRWN